MRHTAAKLTMDENLSRIQQARHHDPFEVLGRHACADGWIVRVCLPHAESAWVEDDAVPMQRVPDSDIFVWQSAQTPPDRYQIRWLDRDGREHMGYDPYCFPPQLSDYDMHLFSEGNHWHAWRLLGAHQHRADGVDGTLFSTWAPNAERVSVVGDFNAWDGRSHPMRTRGRSGVWELFVPTLAAGTLYKFEVRDRAGQVFTKIDPYARHFEQRPKTACIVSDATTYPWHDELWMQRRQTRGWLEQPLSIYEVHLGSWQRDEHGGFLNYRELAHRLVAYLTPLNFSHIELLPITEHPLDESWGYQTTGYYAPTSRFGTPDDFRYFVDHLHRHHIGVILDWVPGHFPKDEFALARFDGSALYEHADPRMGEHREWGTYIFNYDRNEVRNFLLSSALYWLEEFHLDGLRVDAVASMLYLDYSRDAGDWIPNRHGGRENLGAIDFLRQLNSVVHDQHPGAMVIAEESTAWPMVSRPTYLGGLGFSMKWNMGWMHDTLDYFSKEPVHRQHHHELLTFGLLYAFSENFVLPFSHDEVVHGKRSLLYRMPGDEWQQFANLRLLYTYHFTMPGKKLLFMGCEFGQGREWSEQQSIEWQLLQYPLHAGMKQLVGDLNHAYRSQPALHQGDFDQRHFQWLDCSDRQHSVLSYVRGAGDDFVVVVLNFTPVVRPAYRIGVPRAGTYRVLINSDSDHYGGSNVGPANIASEPQPCAGQNNSISVTLPPLAGLVFKRV